MTLSRNKEGRGWSRPRADIAAVVILFALLMLEVLWAQATRLDATRRADRIASLKNRVETSLLRSRTAVMELLSGGDAGLARSQRDAANLALEQSVNFVRQEFAGEPGLVDAAVRLRDLAMGPLNALSGRHLASDASLIEAKAYDNLQYPALKAEADRLFENFQTEVEDLRRVEKQRMALAQSIGLPLGVLTGGVLLYAFWRVVRVTVQTRDGGLSASGKEALDQIVALSREGQAEATRLSESVRAMASSHACHDDSHPGIREKSLRLEAISGFLARIADQTNLLSLNAAIEAEKAGEYGLGFAVIAMEVRRLSDQTLEIQRDVEQIAKGMDPGAEDRSQSLISAESIERAASGLAAGFERISHTATQPERKSGHL
jgi:hypothetical protein